MGRVKGNETYFKIKNEEGRVVIPLAGLTPPHFVPVSCQDLDFRRDNVDFFCEFSEL